MSDIEHAEPAATACGSVGTDKAEPLTAGTGRITRAAYEGDIVSRLRNWRGLHLAHGGRLFEEAADEIERLRLSDAEREAIQTAMNAYGENNDDRECEMIEATLWGLLERTK